MYGIGPAFASGSPLGPNILIFANESFSAQIHLLRRFAKRERQSVDRLLIRQVGNTFQSSELPIALVLDVHFQRHFRLSGNI